MIALAPRHAGERNPLLLEIAAVTREDEIKIVTSGVAIAVEDHGKIADASVGHRMLRVARYRALPGREHAAHVLPRLAVVLRNRGADLRPGAPALRAIGFDFLVVPAVQPAGVLVSNHRFEPAAGHPVVCVRRARPGGIRVHRIVDAPAQGAPRLSSPRIEDVKAFAVPERRAVRIGRIRELERRRRRERDSDEVRRANGGVLRPQRRGRGERRDEDERDGPGVEHHKNG